jgi:hypothetical protein
MPRTAHRHRVVVADASYNRQGPDIGAAGGTRKVRECSSAMRRRSELSTGRMSVSKGSSTSEGLGLAPCCEKHGRRTHSRDSEQG